MKAYFKCTSELQNAWLRFSKSEVFSYDKFFIFQTFLHGSLRQINPKATASCSVVHFHFVTFILIIFITLMDLLYFIYK